MRSYLLRLQEGETFIAVEKQSHAPLFKAQQKFILMPIKPEEVKVGDIVYCKRSPCYRVVKEISSKGFHIYDEHGNDDGWTSKIHGKVII